MLLAEPPTEQGDAHENPHGQERHGDMPQDLIADERDGRRQEHQSRHRRSPVETSGGASAPSTDDEDGDHGQGEDEPR